MAARKPLVLGSSGQPEELSPSDTLSGVTSHTQGTNAGTTGSTFQVDSDGGSTVGVAIKADAGVMAVRNLADTADVVARAAGFDAPYLMGQIWRQYQIGAAHGSATITTNGHAATAVGTQASVLNSAEGPLSTYSTLSTVGTDGGVRTTNSVGRRLHPAVYDFVFYTGPASTDIQNARIVVGIFDTSSPASTDTPSDVACFRFSTAVSDTTWKAVTGGSGTLTTTDSGVTVAFATRYEMRIDNRDTSSIKFWINGVLVATHTTNLPHINSDLMPAVQIRNLTGAVKAIRFSNFRWAIR